MQEFAAIVPAAGSSTRMQTILGMKSKILIELSGKPVILRTIHELDECAQIGRIIVVCRDEDRKQLQKLTALCKTEIILVTGGSDRQESVELGAALAKEFSYLLIHDGARPLISQKVLEKVCIDVKKHKASAVAVWTKDTCKLVDKNGFIIYTPPREKLMQVQTPQVFETSLYLAGIKAASVAGVRYTDDCQMIESMGHPVHLVLGEYRNLKITTPEDVRLAEILLDQENRFKVIGENANGVEETNDDSSRESVVRDEPMRDSVQDNSGLATVRGDILRNSIATDEAEVDILRGKSSIMRVGHGYDVHKLVAGRKLILGGVEIPHELGLLGHSDADVLCHAISDALLGAAGLCDIGTWFPDTDDCFSGASSLNLLNQVYQMLKKRGFQILNVDTTIVAERPKLSTFLPEMKELISATINVESSQINLKATTEEGLGFTGTEAGIAAHAVCMISGTV